MQCIINTYNGFRSRTFLVETEGKLFFMFKIKVLSIRPERKKTVGYCKYMQLSIRSTSISQSGISQTVKSTPNSLRGPICMLQFNMDPKSSLIFSGKEICVVQKTIPPPQ
jgi:predicted transcriptional regulator with HTH domain